MSDVWESKVTLAPKVEVAVRRTIGDTLEELSPGWVYLPPEERAEIAKSLRRIASDVLRRGFPTPKGH